MEFEWGTNGVYCILLLSVKFGELSIAVVAAGKARVLNGSDLPCAHSLKERSQFTKSHHRLHKPSDQGHPSPKNILVWNLLVLLAFA